MLVITIAKYTKHTMRLCHLLFTRELLFMPSSNLSRLFKSRSGNRERYERREKEGRKRPSREYSLHDLCTFRLFRIFRGCSTPGNDDQEFNQRETKAAHDKPPAGTTTDPVVVFRNS